MTRRNVPSICRIACGALALLLVLAVAQPVDAANKFTKKQKRPISMGTSGGHTQDFNTGLGPNICIGGTLGALLKMEDAGETRYFILSTNGNIGMRNRGLNFPEGGRTILQPSRADQNCQRRDGTEAGELTAFKKINFANKDNKVDAAIAETTPELVKTSGAILGIGQPSSQPKNPQVGMLVKKAGAGSGVTRGEIISINTTLQVSYLLSVQPPAEFEAGKFIQQVIIQTTQEFTPFTLAGDTGALVVEDKSNCPAPTGLLFASDPSGAYGVANRIQNVVNLLKNRQPKGKKSFAGCDTAEASRSYVDPAEERAVRFAMRVQRRVEDQLFALSGVAGVGISKDAVGRPAIMVLLTHESKELRQAIPAHVDGVPTKVVVTGPFMAQ